MLAYFCSQLEVSPNDTPNQEVSNVVVVLNAIGQAASAAMKGLAHLIQFTAYMALLTLIYYVSLWITKRIDVYQLLFLSLISLLFSFIFLLFLGSLLERFFNPYYTVCFTIVSIAMALGFWKGVFNKTIV
jgi:hypothetical protein